MSHACESLISISIARHTVQFMLRHALDAKASPCFGLIGRKTLSHNGSTILYAAPIATSGADNFAVSLLENSDIKHTTQRWQQKEIDVCGSYFTTEKGQVPEIEKLISLEQNLKAALTNHLSEPPASSLIHMPLLLGTAGCLEAFAYQIKSDQLCSIPLLLAEDGQQAKNG